MNDVLVGLNLLIPWGQGPSIMKLEIFWSVSWGGVGVKYSLSENNKK